MNLNIDLQVASDEDEHPPPADFKRWVAAAIGNRRDAAQMCIRIVDSAEITQLNGDYRAQPKPTNVLSFPADLPDYIDIPLLGDLVICARVVNEEALQQHKTPQDHWAHMVIHGTLHLLGFDHIIDHEAQVMERLEIELLQSLSIGNPYESIH
ncbi:MAG: putative rRNA maturation factor [Paraglaciecola psychrophila]|jgi:probable rRNA maturation factor